jgi:hypothetical protein
LFSFFLFSSSPSFLPCSFLLLFLSFSLSLSFLFNEVFKLLCCVGVHYTIHKSSYNITTSHTWIHPLHHSLLSPFSHSWNHFNRSHFIIYIHA